MIGDYPGFDEATRRLEKFLTSQGCSGSIVWVRPSDVALIKSDILVFPLEPSASEERARSDYLAACHRKLGVQLGLLCQVKEFSFSYLYMPGSEDEAQRHMMPDGLKLSLPMPVPGATIVTNSREWRRIKIRSRRWTARKAGLFQREC